MGVDKQQTVQGALGDDRNREDVGSKDGEKREAGR